MHRGYYEQGRLSVYRNYHPAGGLEREFRSSDALTSVLRSSHASGNLRSETRYRYGRVGVYQDGYLTGARRFAEERHRTEPYYLRMDLYNDDGTPVSLLQLVDRKRVEFVLREYFPDGSLKCEGRARYVPSRMDTQRIGTWSYYDEAGGMLRQEDYRDGRVAVVR